MMWSGGCSCRNLMQLRLLQLWQLMLRGHRALVRGRLQMHWVRLLRAAIGMLWRRPVHWMGHHWGWSG